jgi:hypothetical protein
MPVGAKSTGSTSETYALLLSGNIVSLEKYLHECKCSPPILRIGFSLTRLKKWKRAYDYHQNSRPVSGR